MARFFSASVTTTKCQFWLLEPVGACTASSRHSRISSGSTGREKSRRLRTARVVESSSSGVRFSNDMDCSFTNVYKQKAGHPQGDVPTLPPAQGRDIPLRV